MKAEYYPILVCLLTCFELCFFIFFENVLSYDIKVKHILYFDKRFCVLSCLLIYLLENKTKILQNVALHT